mmetsp:Transcript_9373/g.27508  ORF Transcript_9373/g.27508 Transcript_9373/m.27508 type:complete len:484 (-) Transcript_9373:171-1622(-)|eukprot:CAMPEP_0118883584 /NCGR_PEP_ID=MMETSP1163-20130328/22622_1 /TAXON_ID=124430 /ORGANISM="Phaeomonas parva, Strain CCMP2877" /LENGTH=483 /DNA_ID=CAMNT_0006821049 /DNA_START=165 /DNA_END=1616 /DNA_ORIENTATION=+
MSGGGRGRGSRTSRPSAEELGGVIRVKPLGVGGASPGEGGDGASAISVDGRTVTVTGASRTTDCSFATYVAEPGVDNTQVYDELMRSRVDAFFEGYNVNLLAYGQTGSGKTHTMFGPPGIMSRAGAGAYGIDVCEDYGLFPRGVIAIFRRAQQENAAGNGKRYLVSCGAIELSIMGNEDMFHKSDADGAMGFDLNGIQKGIVIDDVSVPPGVRGHEEFVVSTERDILRVFAAMAARNTNSTELNDSSSRSHCIAWLHLHRFDAADGTVAKTKFQFCDLAGSERMKDAHGSEDYRDGGMEGWQGMVTNFSLMMLSQAVRQKVQLQRKGKRFSFKQAKFACPLVPLLHGSICGTDLTALIVCCSSDPANASQTINALDFGAAFAKLHVNKRAVRPKPLAALLDAARGVVREQTAALSGKRAGGEQNRYTIMRRAKLRDAEQLVDLLQSFGAGNSGGVDAGTQAEGSSGGGAGAHEVGAQRRGSMM